MESLQFKVQDFEGPLDLLLTLIAKHKMDIFHVSIEDLLIQYLAAVEQMRAENPDIASEFLEMAAHLVYIKTVSLLPKPEEAEALKDELVGRLLEYQLCKEIAARLRNGFCGYDIFVRQMTKVPINQTYRHQHDAMLLKEAYLVAAGRGKRLPPETSVFEGIVTRRMVSVKSRILHVLKRLYEQGQMPYNDFFCTNDRAEMVATFLALLELVKNSRIYVSEDNETVSFNRAHADQDTEEENWDALLAEDEMEEPEREQNSQSGGTT